MSPGDISSVSPVCARSDEGAPQKLPAKRGKKTNSTSATGAAFSSIAPVVRNGRSAGPAAAAQRHAQQRRCEQPHGRQHPGGGRDVLRVQEGREAEEPADEDQHRLVAGVARLEQLQAPT